jgi:hypothetical protein
LLTFHTSHGTARKEHKKKQHNQSNKKQDDRLTWPKIIGYADDITIIAKNTNKSVKPIFHEYEMLPKASGLKGNGGQKGRPKHH